MSAEQNKAALRCIREVVFNCGNLELIDELFASDYIEHTPVPPGWPRSGLEGFKMFITTLRSAFPDVHYTVETIFAEAEMAAGSITARGTHRGEFFGIAPTGREVTWTETHVGRYENGKLVEHWDNSDDLGMLQQIGAILELGEQGVEPLSRYAVEFSTTTGKRKGIARPVLFGTAIALPHPRLFGLEILGEGGWLKTLRLADYAPRRRRARDRFCRACYPTTSPGGDTRPGFGACPLRLRAAAELTGARRRWRPSPRGSPGSPIPRRKPW